MGLLSGQGPRPKMNARQLWLGVSAHLPWVHPCTYCVVSEIQRRYFTLRGRTLQVTCLYQPWPALGKEAPGDLGLWRCTLQSILKSPLVAL